jgi:hypothetical protein
MFVLSLSILIVFLLTSETTYESKESILILES